MGRGAINLAANGSLTKLPQAAVERFTKPLAEIDWQEAFLMADKERSLSGDDHSWDRAAIKRNILQ